MRHTLKLHPDSNSRAIAAITVAVNRSLPQVIELHYIAEGDISRVRVPLPAQGKRRDELWKHTCFEAFLRPPTGEAYAEFNFSPSTEFAAYSFTGYRDGMREAHCSQMDVHAETSPTRLDLRATIGIRVAEFDMAGPLRLGLSAIIEETSGAKSYWALAHPQGKPDFHHADSFVLDLPWERT
jgi:hypothetical protein